MPNDIRGDNDFLDTLDDLEIQKLNIKFPCISSKKGLNGISTVNPYSNNPSSYKYLSDIIIKKEELRNLLELQLIQRLQKQQYSPQKGDLGESPVISDFNTTATNIHAATNASEVSILNDEVESTVRTINDSSISFMVLLEEE